MKFSKLNRWFICTSLFFSLGFSGFAQSADFQTWNALEVEKKVSDNFDVNFEQEIRVAENSTQFNVSNTTIGGVYSINKTIKTGLGYRFSNAYELEEGTSQSHRLFADLLLKQKAGDFILSFRERAMFEKEGEKSSYQSYNAEWYLRHRLQIKYNVPEISLFPYIEAEIFQSLNNPVKNTIDKMRLTGGLQYNFPYDISLSVYYRYQSTQKWMKTKKEVYILGTTISYSF